MAPYVAVVDSTLLHAASRLGANVDVSFMKDDFARLIAERMLICGMRAVLSADGPARAAELLDVLTGMVESHGQVRSKGRECQPLTEWLQRSRGSSEVPGARLLVGENS